MHDDQCSCLEKVKLKVEQEIDRLQGIFRQKEEALLNPLISKFKRLEESVTSQVNQLKIAFEIKVGDMEQSLIVSEQTTGFILNSIQNLMGSLRIR